MEMIGEIVNNQSNIVEGLLSMGGEIIGVESTLVNKPTWKDALTSDYPMFFQVPHPVYWTVIDDNTIVYTPDPRFITVENAIKKIRKEEDVGK